VSAATRNPAGAYRDARELVDGALLQSLDSEQQYQALFLAARLAIDLERIADANALLRRSSETEHATLNDWFGRFRTGVEVKDYSDALFALKQLVARFPDKLATIYPPSIYVALRDLRSDSRADVATEILEILFAGRWLADAGQEPSGAWRDLALARLERNDLAGAVEVAARIASPEVLIAMRADKRFDAVVAALPSRFDIERAVDGQLESLRKAVATAPDKIEPLSLLVFALRSAGRFDEGLALADDALARATNPNRVSPYSDGSTQVVWLRNARSEILWTMGRHAEAADELKKASDVEGNVSQRINYAGLLVKLGRGREALPLLRDLDASAYGRMQAATLEVAAANQAGDRRAATRALAYLHAHESDAIGALQSGLMSMRDVDAAARLFIKRLESTEWRGDALLEAQTYVDAPRTPHESETAAGLAALLARPDVRAALESVGRIESHPIHAP
jgi:beta-barrel assembly-enhancing protease